MERPESVLEQRNRQLEAVFRITSALYARAKEGLRAPAFFANSMDFTGRGMPTEVLERLFTGQAVSTKAGGTGLGTQIVKNVVDAHGGTIEVRSEPSKGTTFRIRLPLERMSEQNS